MNDRVTFLTTDEIENWNTKLHEMSLADLQRCSERLEHALDAYSTSVSIKREERPSRQRLLEVLEACNRERQERPIKEGQRTTTVLVVKKGYPPFELGARGVETPPQIGKTFCPVCKLEFALHSSETAAAEIQTGDESVEKTLHKELIDQHSKMQQHPPSIYLKLPIKKPM